MIPSQNPLHPITLDDYPKLFDYVLTADGLKYFQDLRHQYYQGRNLSLDQYNKLRLLYVYYATANRNQKEVLAWQQLCIDLDNQGIFEKQMYASKEDLIKQSLITKNPLYHSGLYRQHTEYVKNNFKPKND